MGKALHQQITTYIISCLNEQGPSTETQIHGYIQQRLIRDFRGNHCPNCNTAMNQHLLHHLTTLTDMGVLILEDQRYRLPGRLSRSRSRTRSRSGRRGRARSDGSKFRSLKPQLVEGS